MSILMKGMKMPKNCDSCWLSRMRGSSLGGILDCKIIGTVGSNMHDPYDILNNRHPDCPLIELPEKHGRLIDGDAVFDWYIKAFNSYPKIEPNEVRFSMNDIAGNLLNMPTIIEAEGDEK